MSPQGLAKIAPVPSRNPIVPVLSSTERRAYQAAWRILREDDYAAQLEGNQFACEATRRSRRVDRIADIIREEMTPGGKTRSMLAGGCWSAEGEEAMVRTPPLATKIMVG